MARGLRPPAVLDFAHPYVNGGHAMPVHPLAQLSLKLQRALASLSPDELDAFAADVRAHHDEHALDHPGPAGAWLAVLAFVVADHDRRERDRHVIEAEADFAMGGDKGEQVVPPPETGEG